MQEPNLPGEKTFFSTKAVIISYLNNLDYYSTIVLVIILSLSYTRKSDGKHFNRDIEIFILSNASRAS